MCSWGGFCGGTEKLSLVSGDFFGGTATRRDGEAGSRACARKAHRYSPACRARGKEGRQKRGVIEEIKPDSREGKRRFPEIQGLTDFCVFGCCSREYVVLGVSTYSLYRESVLGGWFLGARLETDLAPWWDRLFNQLADAVENLLNVGIIALALLFEFVKLLGEFPVCAGCHFANYLA